LKAPRERPIRGDVNVILNGLLREGVIAGFETSFDKEAPAKRVGITVVAGTAMSPEAVEKAIRTALDRFSDQVIVTVKPG
jgi:F420-dependent methylenetetrahydromethanopterin dehydrogenase